MSRWLLALVAGLATACTGLDDHKREADALRAQRDAGTRLYWLGESYGGLPLTATDVDLPRRGVLVYGECDGETEGVDGFHCTKAQLQVQFMPFDAVPWRLVTHCRLRASLRGVPTLRHDGLVLVTRDGLVKIYGRTRAEDRRVALALRPVGGVRRALLPAPTPRQRRAVVAACS
jgi:hypothetical protein